LKVDPQLCTGCRMCEMECSHAHEQRFGTSISRIRVSKLEEIGVDYPVVCQLCGKAPCVAACPEGALRIAETGIIVVDAARCKGSGACVEACPFGAVDLHPETGLPLFCDLCEGSPACVEGCPTGALRCVESRKPARERMRRLSAAAQSRRDAYVEKVTRTLVKKWGGE
jgi:carbon-monoxide dehydrogenase iron sulfur subunit